MSKRQEFQAKWKAEQDAKDEEEFRQKNEWAVVRNELHKTVIDRLAKKRALEAKRRERVKLANEHGMAMPLGNGTCFCCIDNSKAFNAIQIYDLLTVIFIITIPRALGAMKQRQAGNTEVTIYSKLRIANWLLILILSAIGLCLYLRTIAEDDDIDIRYHSNESKVAEIVGLCALTIVALILDFHLCQVVAFKMTQLKFLHEQKYNPDRYLLNETE